MLRKNKCFGNYYSNSSAFEKYLRVHDFLPPYCRRDFILFDAKIQGGLLFFPERRGDLPLRGDTMIRKNIVRGTKYSTWPTFQNYSNFLNFLQPWLKIDTYRIPSRKRNFTWKRGPDVRCQTKWRLQAENIRKKIHHVMKIC